MQQTQTVGRFSRWCNSREEQCIGY